MAPPDNTGRAGRSIPDLSPETRRRVAAASPEVFKAKFHPYRGRGARALEVAQRAAVGTWNDGSIHAGNFAYLAMVAIFPFFILGAAALSLFGNATSQAASLTSVLAGFPPSVQGAIEPVAEYVISARSGWLLWAGAAVGLWTAGNLVETLRDVLRRAYGTPQTLPFWRTRLYSSLLILLWVVVLLLSLFSSVLLESARQLISAWVPELEAALRHLSFSQIIPALGLYGSLLMLFITLTPSAYRPRRYPKWPGALLVTGWIMAVTLALPRLLRTVFAYDLTYGSLAGIMITLFFFWLVGLGMVAGAELNAALAVSPEEEEAER